MRERCNERKSRTRESGKRARGREVAARGRKLEKECEIGEEEA